VNNRISFSFSAADTLITVENNKLLQIANKSTTIVDSFKMSDAVLCNAIEGISQIINQHSEINLDFADVKTIMKDMGRAIIGIGSSDDDTDPVTLAVKAALDSPLLSGIDISGAKGLVVHYTCSKNISLMDLEKGQTIIDDAISGDNEANIMFGLAIDKDMENGVKAMIIVTGFESLQ